MRERERPVENGGTTKDSYTIGEVVARLKPEFPTLSVSKIRYLERRRLINLSRTRGGYRLFSNQDIELLRYILTLQDKEYLPLKVIKKRIEGGAPVTSTDSTGDLSRVLEDRTYTREELADTLEVESRFVDDLIAAGDREAAMFKQILNPELRSSDEQRVAEAMNKARHLAAVDSRLKELMMANAIETFAP